MNTKIFMIVFLSALGFIITGSILGNLLEPNETLFEVTIGSKEISALKLAFFLLFCVMIFAFVPLVVRFFIYMQVKIGNQEFFLVKFIQLHERSIVYGAWIMMLIGFGIIFSLGKDDILNDFK